MWAYCASSQDLSSYRCSLLFQGREVAGALRIKVQISSEISTPRSVAVMKLQLRVAAMSENNFEITSLNFGPRMSTLLRVRIPAMERWLTKIVL